MNRLQVRQLQLNTPSNLRAGPPMVSPRYVASADEWLDVPSPSWLIGFVIPHTGLAYEFRQSSEES